MDNSLGSPYNNSPSPFKGVISEFLDRRRSRRDEDQKINAEHERRMAEQAMAHQHATDRIYHQGAVDYALQDQRAGHSSGLSAQESRQRMGEQRFAATVLRDAGGGQPVSSMSIPGGSVSFGSLDEKKKAARRGKRQFAPAQASSSPVTAPPAPMSPQFSSAGSAHTPQSSEPRISRTGL